MSEKDERDEDGRHDEQRDGFPEMSAEQEFFLYELETTDSASVGLVLRAIYDTGDVAKFTRALERRIANYDKNILKVCTYHYQGFLDSPKRPQHAGRQVCGHQDVDQQIQADGTDLQRVSAEIVRYRKLQRNANVAIDQISMFLQALKVLEDLEHNYFPHIYKYRFTQSLAKGVLPIRKQIRDSSRSPANVGEDASKHIANQSTTFTSTQKTPVEAQRKKPASDVKFDKQGAIVRQPSQSGAPSRGKFEEDEEETTSAQDRIDYAPIHRCCQVFNVLGEKDAFERYYREQRREQCLVISQTPSKVAESIHVYVKYLNEVMGFFIVEDRIMQIQPTLVTAAHKDQLFEMALQKVTAAMNSHFGNCLNVEMMMRMKKVILLFILTMKSFGYSTNPLYSLLQNFRDQYNEILMREYCAQFDVALQNDNYTPLIVNNEEEYRAVLQDFPHHKRGHENVGRTLALFFPFSAFVPKVFGQAKNYLKGCLGFMHNLQLSQSEVEDTGSLKAFVTGKDRSMIQLVQSTINIGYLEKSCDSLERFISKITSQGEDVGGGGSSHLVTLKPHVFQELRSEVEQLIETALRRKVDVFLEDANYDWELPEPRGQASGYITDLCSFFGRPSTRSPTCRHLLARHVCMQVSGKMDTERSDWRPFRRASTWPTASTRASSRPTTTRSARAPSEQFSLDEMQCEDFAAKAPVEGFDESTLPMTFAHLRQLLDLVINEDWSTYLSGRNQENFQYDRVKTTDAAMLLEKLLEFEKKGNGISRNWAEGKTAADSTRRSSANYALSPIESLLFACPID
ncbi:Exocyst complex component [Aphelenchoides fujianensis]|nr:Exocyst complex component [Aphelenchoides fujianensis]